jgi:hypothetical protein
MVNDWASRMITWESPIERSLPCPPPEDLLGRFVALNPGIRHQFPATNFLLIKTELMLQIKPWAAN